MIIEPAEPTDAKAICVLWNWMIRDTLSTFTTTEKTVADISEIISSRRGSFFVAKEDGALLGFVTFGPFRSGPGYAAAVEHSVIVQPASHGRGIGQKLMKSAFNAAKEQGKHVLVAAISSANPDALDFHTALGFDQVGLLPEVGRKNGQWLDLVLMQKMLTDPA